MAGTLFRRGYIEIIDNQETSIIRPQVTGHVKQLECLDNPSYVIDIFMNKPIKKLFDKLDSKSISLLELVDILNGIATHKNKLGILDSIKDEHSKPILFGKDIARYSYSFSGQYVDYVRERLHRARDEQIFLAKEKLIMQRIGGILITTYDDKQYYTFNSVNNIIPKDNIRYALKYLLGILNSALLRQYYIVRFTNRSSLTVNISKTFLSQLPIRTIDFDNPDDVKKHDQMVSLVETMLDLHKQLPDASGEAKRIIESRIESTDRQIDALVYELYGLTDEEIKIVEGM